MLHVMANIYNIYMCTLHSYGRTVIAKSVKLSPAKACPLFRSRGLVLHSWSREGEKLVCSDSCCLYCGCLKWSCTGICYVISFFSFSVGWFFT